MTMHTSLIGFCLMTIISACGPKLSNEVDPEQIIAAFCDNLFQCPETIALLGYESIDECEDIHRNDYEMRDSTCRARVLLFEECLSELTCEELADDLPCNEQLDFLTERCHGL